MSMNRRATIWTLALASLATWATSAHAQQSASQIKSPALPLAAVSPAYRNQVHYVVSNATLFARGPVESFPCRPDHYFWLLENPDRAVTAWERLGAKCVKIDPQGNGSFRWQDEKGSEIIWRTVYRDKFQRIWYAQGKVKPGRLLPNVPVQAVLVLRHSQSASKSGDATITHQSDLYIYTNRRSAKLAMRVLGNSADRVAEQGLAQMQMFFSALSYYLDRNPERVETLLQK